MKLCLDELQSTPRKTDAVGFTIILTNNILKLTLKILVIKYVSYLSTYSL